MLRGEKYHRAKGGKCDWKLFKMVETTKAYFCWTILGCSTINVERTRWFSLATLLVQSFKHLSSPESTFRWCKSTTQWLKHLSVILLYISKNSLNFVGENFKNQENPKEYNLHFLNLHHWTLPVDKPSWFFKFQHTFQLLLFVYFEVARLSFWAEIVTSTEISSQILKNSRFPQFIISISKSYFCNFYNSRHLKIHR